MKNGKMSGYVEPIVGEVNLLSGKAYMVLRANMGDVDAEVTVVYEDELEKMLSTNDAVILSLGND